MQVHRCPPLPMRGLVAAVGAVGVGDRFPPADQLLELLERHQPGMLQEDVEHITQLVADSGVGVGAGDLMRLRHPQQGILQRLGDRRERRRKFRRPHPGPGVTIGPAGQRPTPPLHVRVLILPVQLAAVDITDQLDHLRFEQTMLLLQHLQPIDRTRPIQLRHRPIPHRLEHRPHRRHDPIITKGATQLIPADGRRDVQFRRMRRPERERSDRARHASR